LNQFIDTINSQYTILSKSSTKKEFAINVTKEVKKEFQAIMFKLYNMKEPRDTNEQIIRNFLLNDLKKSVVLLNL